MPNIPMLKLVGFPICIYHSPQHTLDLQNYTPEVRIVLLGMCVILLGLLFLSLQPCTPPTPDQSRLWDPRVFTGANINMIVLLVCFAQLGSTNEPSPDKSE